MARARAQALDNAAVSERLGRISAAFYRRYPAASPRLLESHPPSVVRCADYRAHSSSHRLEGGLWRCLRCDGAQTLGRTERGQHDH